MARWWWVVSTKPRPLYPQERPGTHCRVGWVGPRESLEGCGKSRPPTGIRSPDRLASSESLYRLSYSDPRTGCRVTWNVQEKSDIRKEEFATLNTAISNCSQTFINRYQTSRSHIPKPPIFQLQGREIPSDMACNWFFSYRCIPGSNLVAVSGCARTEILCHVRITAPPSPFLPVHLILNVLTLDTVVWAGGKVTVWPQIRQTNKHTNKLTN